MKYLTITAALALTVSTNAQAASVIPSGMSVGVKLYTDGITVAGVETVEDKGGRRVSPASDCGIKKGDIIYSANGHALSTIGELADELEAAPDGTVLEVRRGSETLTITADPAETEDGTSKLGIWVRDSTAGIGTLTYFMPENSSFAALGHGICDADTGNILTVRSGNILKCADLSVKKSRRGDVGELDAVFSGPDMGDLYVNSTTGIYGSMKVPVKGEAIEAAEREDVHEGEAYILTDAAGNGVERYGVELQKVNRDSTDSKAIVLKITDKRLLDAAGGIVRGMSGAPIIQDGRLAGAVTHVFVNDPTRGYGIMAQTMLDDSVRY